MQTYHTVRHSIQDYPRSLAFHTSFKEFPLSPVFSKDFPNYPCRLTTQPSLQQGLPSLSRNLTFHTPSQIMHTVQSIGRTSQIIHIVWLPQGFFRLCIQSSPQQGFPTLSTQYGLPHGLSLLCTHSSLQHIQQSRLPQKAVNTYTRTFGLALQCFLYFRKPILPYALLGVTIHLDTEDQVSINIRAV